MNSQKADMKHSISTLEIDITCHPLVLFIFASSNKVIDLWTNFGHTDEKESTSV